ncbi:MAG: phosphotransferase [Steroidobacterales bacterium]
MSAAGNYPHRPRQVLVLETHFAWVFLAGRYAYKLKKPVRHLAMDYRGLAGRKRGCQEEIRLNRRLAPSVYLSVIPLTLRGGSLSLGKHGRVQDWLVRMRRLSLPRMLDRTLLTRSLGDQELERLTRMLARFYARAKPAPTARGAYLARLRRGVSANRAALRAAGPAIRQALVESVTQAQRDFIHQARTPIAARGAHVVEGHGDLRAEHVCLGPPMCIIDCLEFSRDLRLLDPVEELAFLSLEIGRLGHKALGADLLRRFLVASNDHVPESVESFYLSYRASVRAKLAIWHLRDSQYTDPRPWIRRTNSYLRDADRHIRQALSRLRRPGPASA